MADTRKAGVAMARVPADDPHPAPREVVQAYVAARDSARASSAFWVRWQVRRLARLDTADTLNDCGRAMLRAFREELGARGLEVPA